VPKPAPRRRKPKSNGEAPRRARPAKPASNGATSGAETSATEAPATETPAIETPGGAYLRGCAALNQELVHAAARRLARATETARTLTSCATPTAAWAAWIEAARTAAQDAAGEMERMGQICVGATAEIQNELASGMANAPRKPSSRSSSS